MGKLETQTTHTVKLYWNQRTPLEKGDLIRGLTDTLPNGALITELAVADTTKEEPDYTTPPVIRTLTITYMTNPALDRYRR